MRIKISLAVLSCLCATPLLAQQGRTGVEGLQFIAPLQITTGRDNNFLVDRTDPNEKLLVLSLPGSVQPAAPEVQPKLTSDEFFTATLPKVAYQNYSRRHEFTATYVPDFELFVNNPDQSAFNHQATAAFGYFLSRKFQILLGDSYLTSHDPARTKQNVFLLLPRGPYRENALRAAFEFVPNTRTAMDFSYDTSWAKFGQFTAPFQTEFLNTRSSGYTFSVTRMLNRRQRLRGLYSVFRIAPLHDTSRANDSVDIARSFEKPVHSGVLQYRLGINRTTLIEATGGVISLTTGLNYTLGGSLDKRIATYYWLGAGYTRTLAFFSPTPSGFPTGLGANGFYDQIVLKFRGQPTTNSGVRVDTTISRSASSPLLRTSKSLMASARLDYRVTDRSTVFASVESYHQNSNPFVISPVSRTRFAVGVEYSLSSDAQRRSNPLNEDDMYVALTDRARRRGVPPSED